MAHAIKVYYVCNDETMESTSETTDTDAATSMKVTIAKLEVTRSHVMDVIGKFTCSCHAASSKGEVVSNEAVIKTASESLSLFYGS